MKKTLTTLLTLAMAATSLTASAVDKDIVILEFTGSGSAYTAEEDYTPTSKTITDYSAYENVNDDWKGNLIVTNSLIKEAIGSETIKEGDEILISTSNAAEGLYVKFFFNGNWSADDGAVEGDNLVSNWAIRHTLTAKQAEDANAGDLTIQHTPVKSVSIILKNREGGNVDPDPQPATSVTVLDFAGKEGYDFSSGSDYAPEYNIIYDYDYANSTSWGPGVMVSAQLFKNVLTELKAGDVVVLYMGNGYNDSFKAIYGGWAYSGDEKSEEIKGDSYSGSEARIALDDEKATRIWENGLLLQRLNLNSVSVISSNGIENGATSQPVIGDDVVWSGEQAFPNGSDVETYRFNISKEDVTINPGDEITLTLKGTGQDCGLKVGAAEGEETVPDDDYLSWISHWDGNGVEYSDVITVTEAMAVKLNKENGCLVVTGKNFNLTKITINRVGTPVRKYTDVVIFDPADYYDQYGDKEWGLSTEPEEKWLGTGKFEKDEATGEVYYNLFYEWYDSSNYNDDGSNRQWYWTNVMKSDETRTHTRGLNLTRENIPAFSKVKFGDKIIVTLRTYETPYKDQLPEKDHVNPEGQLGTYNPEVEGYDPEDPWSGFEAISDNGFKSWEEGVQDITVEFPVNMKLLEQMTRYGLSINGRLFSVRKVVARVYSDEDNTENGSYTIVHHFYNHLIKPESFTKDASGNEYEVEVGAVYEIRIESGRKYNEVITAYYDNEGGLLQGSKTEMLDEYKTDEEVNDFQVMYRFLNADGVYERMHVAAFLGTDNYPNTTGGEAEETVSYAMSREQQKLPQSDVIFANGINGQTYFDQANSQYVLRFWPETKEAAERIAANGMQVRGKGIEYVDNGGVATGIRAVGAVDDADATEEIYTVSGLRVTKMERGNLYIVRCGGKTMKIAY